MPGVSAMPCCSRWTHDRFWHDGRLRNGYLAGAVGAAPLKLAGWWSSRDQRWLEDDYQAGSDTGNLAWAMLALLRLERNAHDHDPGYRDGRYLAGAKRLGGWLAGQRDQRGRGRLHGRQLRIGDRTSRIAVEVHRAQYRFGRGLCMAGRE